MSKAFLRLFFLILLLAPAAFAAGQDEGDFPDFIFTLPKAQKEAMDINPDRFADFWKNWHFVATRWRQDIHEFRMTYANDLAWKTLSEQRTDYPVGAMFGKLVYPAEEDLALPSSVLPANMLTRLMVMLWDPKNPHAGSDGWVYLRFINNQPGVPQDKNSTGIWGVMSQKEVKACVECHARAYDRGYVFSQPTYLFRDKKLDAKTKPQKVTTNRVGEAMKAMAPHDVPRIAANLIESFPEWKGRKQMGYAGDFFAGALGEMGPVLAKLAQANPDTVYMLFDRDDPNTIEIASRIEKKGYENCAGIVFLRGTMVDASATEIDAYHRILEKAALLEKNGGNDTMVKADADWGEAPDANSSKEKQALSNNPNTAGNDAPSAQPGARIRDMAQQYKPAAILNTVCGADNVSRQYLPLLYTVKEKDGLPGYYFAPRIKE